MVPSRAVCSVLPSMKSRSSIFTLRGLSFLLRSMSAVTNWYLSNSSVRSCGKAFFLGVHLLSRFDSPSAKRVAFPLRWIYGVRAAATAGRAPRARHCDARCEKSWRKICVTTGESIDAGAERFDDARDSGSYRRAVRFAVTPSTCQDTCSQSFTPVPHAT
jgi:hypothetical protein